MSLDVIFFFIAGIGFVVVILGSMFIGTSSSFSKKFDKEQ